MRPMTIGAFTRYKEQVENWLKAFVTSFTTDDTYASYWFHPGSNGFGLIIIDYAAMNTGEFHLSSDGNVSVRVEHGSAVVFSDRHKVTHFHEFEDRFRHFKAKIVQRKTAT
jgi:hypothetical protein